MYDPGLQRYPDTASFTDALVNFIIISYEMVLAVLYVLCVRTCLSLSLSDGILYGVYR